MMSKIQKLAMEIRIWAKLDHEFVLPLLGFIIEGGEYDAGPRITVDGKGHLARCYEDLPVRRY